MDGGGPTSGPVAESAEVADILREAARLAGAWNHHWLGTEHLILAVLDAEEHGRVPPRFTSRGLTRPAAEAEVASLVPPRAEREHEWSGVVLTPRVQRICGVAEGWALADAWPDAAVVHPDHLAFALLRDGDGVAAHVVRSAGVDPADLAADLADDLVARRAARPGERRG